MDDLIPSKPIKQEARSDKKKEISPNQKKPKEKFIMIDEYGDEVEIDEEEIEKLKKEGYEFDMDMDEEEGEGEEEGDYGDELEMQKLAH